MTLNAAGRPSRPLMALRWAVSSGMLQRGYGWLLRNVPTRVWGGENVSIPTEVGSLVMSVKDPANSGLLLLGQIPHETGESLLVRTLAREFQITFDIGSHIGWYACLMWDSMGDSGTVYAFEPNPFTFPYLVENARKRPGILPSQLAIGGKQDSLTFYCADSSNLSSASRQVGTPVLVEGISLDMFAERQGLIGHIDFIKCDVEGGEMAVLQGSRLVRSAAYPPIWMIEADDKFLAEAGFSINSLNSEMSNSEDSARLFYLNPGNKIVEIGHVRERNGVPNIFLVPEVRMLDFQSAVLSTGIISLA